MRTEIVYEDRDVLVVYKPSGLAVQTAKTGQQDVVSELKNYLRQPYLGIVHRLDQPVEGLLVFAGNKSAAAGLTAQLSGGVLNKCYYAVLCGEPVEKEGRFEDDLYKGGDNRAVVVERAKNPSEIGSMKNGRMGEKIVKTDGGVEKKDVGGKAAAAKRAALTYRVLQVIESPARLAMAEIVLETGRFHQIRAQMAFHGLPLLGDQKYGNEESLALAGRLGVKSVALCACKLIFSHPVSGKKMEFRIDPKGAGFSFFSLS